MSEMSTRRSIPNTFGVGSPGWNLPFPEGNLTAAEILAYLPHWLKSIDVIRRFHANGGDIRGFTQIIANMITRYRYSPLDNRCDPQSIYKMIREALCRNHLLGDGVQPKDVTEQWQSDPDWDSLSISVSGFRCPRVTHPKTGQWIGPFNDECPPIQFRDLARYVRQHPSGNDALDLTRCVLHALEHPDEGWLFPTDYARMVEMLGGPQEVTHFHTDREVFRRHNYRDDPKARARGQVDNARAQSGLDGEASGIHRESFQPRGGSHNTRVDTYEALPQPRYDSPQLFYQISQHPAAHQLHDEASQVHGGASQAQPNSDLVFQFSGGWPEAHIGHIVPQHRRQGYLAQPPRFNPAKTLDYQLSLIDPVLLAESEGEMGPRHSGRLTVKLRNIKTPKYADPTDSEPEDSDSEDSKPPTRSSHRLSSRQTTDRNAGTAVQGRGFSGYTNASEPVSNLTRKGGPTQKLILRNGPSRSTRMRASSSKHAKLMEDDSADAGGNQMDGDDASDSEDFDEKMSDSELSDLEDTNHGQKHNRNLRSRAPTARVPTTRARRAKKVATRKSRARANSNGAPPPSALALPQPISPDVQEAARTFDERQPAYLAHPGVNPDRLKIDQHNVFLYSEDGAKDHWASAYSPYRYKSGPRRWAPFRELHMLSDPRPDDFSNWAENIRWAKQQHRLYGSAWLEWEGDLDMIAEHRVTSFWASEELISSGGLPTSN